MIVDAERNEGRDISCFVVGPIGDRDADPASHERLTYEDAIRVYEQIIEPACLGYGIRPVRGDQISRGGEIAEQVFRALRDSHLVIADLTGGNPNVMYELGLRHTTGKLTIQICERGRLPFDVAGNRMILFRRSEGGFVDARRRLTSAIADALERGGDPVTATRVWFELGSSALESQVAERHSGGEEDEEPGYLEKVAELSEGMDSLFLTLDSLTAVINEIGASVNESTARVVELNRAGGSTAAAKLTYANELAAKLEDPASRLEVLTGEYRRSVERMHPGMLYILSEAKDREDEQSAKFRENVRQFIQMTHETWPTIRAYQKVLHEGGEAARTIRRVNRRISTALNQQLDTERFFREWEHLL